MRLENLAPAHTDIEEDVLTRMLNANKVSTLSCKPKKKLTCSKHNSDKTLTLGLDDKDEAERREKRR